MADLIVVPSSVLQVGTGNTGVGTAGATITAGQSISRDANGKWVPAGAAGDDVLAGSNLLGIALNSASPDQPVSYILGGTVNLGVATAAGEIYVVSATPGGIAPNTDLLATQYLSIIGYGDASAQLVMSVTPTGVQHG